jgi:hypothetical protein
MCCSEDRALEESLEEDHLARSLIQDQGCEGRANPDLAAQLERRNLARLCLMLSKPAFPFEPKWDGSVVWPSAVAITSFCSPPGFTGRAPGGPSRWSTKRSSEWQPLKPKLVCEVSYDHFSGGRFRHGTKFLRWRPEKRPDQCRFDQVQRHG